VRKTIRGEGDTVDRLGFLLLHEFEQRAELALHLLNAELSGRRDGQGTASVVPFDFRSSTVRPFMVSTRARAGRENLLLNFGRVSDVPFAAFVHRIRDQVANIGAALREADEHSLFELLNGNGLDDVKAHFDGLVGIVELDGPAAPMAISWCISRIGMIEGSMPSTAEVSLNMLVTLACNRLCAGVVADFVFEVRLLGRDHPKTLSEPSPCSSILVNGTNFWSFIARTREPPVRPIPRG